MPTVDGVYSIVTAANATHFTYTAGSSTPAASGTLAHTRILQFDLSGVT